MYIEDLGTMDGINAGISAWKVGYSPFLLKFISKFVELY